MKFIYALCDYKGRFGSKHFDKPYRSGMDKGLLTEAFKCKGIEIEFCSMSDTNLMSKLSGTHFIYTSQEDAGYYYKSFIEDVVYGLEMAGAYPLPGFRYLRANNNKVFMEMMRKMTLPEKYHLDSKWFGSAEESFQLLANLDYPIVVKDSKGAGSLGVRLATDQHDLVKNVSRISRTRNFGFEIRDMIRFLKHKGYTRESLYRKKFILQNYVSGINNDWKILVFSNKYFVLRRNNRPGDFRASGSGLFSFDDMVNPVLLDAAKEVKNFFKVPFISIDMALSCDKVVLIEFQFVYFGTSTLEKSPYYYFSSDSGWKQVHEKSVLEQVYADAVVDYIED